MFHVKHRGRDRSGGGVDGVWTVLAGVWSALEQLCTPA
jgi:hypothetical protein